jgi:hypothetical protein
MKITKQNLRKLINEAMNDRKVQTAYVRATGNNRFANAGSSRWLRIRKINRTLRGYEIEIRTQFGQKFIDISDKFNQNVEFKLGSMPVPWRMIKDIYGFVEDERVDVDLDDALDKIDMRNIKPGDTIHLRRAIGDGGAQVVGHDNSGPWMPADEDAIKLQVIEVEGAKRLWSPQIDVILPSGKKAQLSIRSRQIDYVD